MPPIKSMQVISEKYTRVTPQRQQDYTQGVGATAPEKWSQNTAASAPAWTAGVSAAAASGRFASGVDGKGAKWKAAALGKGATRFGPGVTAAGPDYTAGFTRYHDVIANTQLNPRGPRGDPGNIQRVATLAQALHTARVGAGR